MLASPQLNVQCVIARFEPGAVRCASAEKQCTPSPEPDPGRYDGTCVRRERTTMSARGTAAGTRPWHQSGRVACGLATAVLGRGGLRGPGVAPSHQHAARSSIDRRRAVAGGGAGGAQPNRTDDATARTGRDSIIGRINEKQKVSATAKKNAPPRLIRQTRSSTCPA